MCSFFVLDANDMGVYKEAKGLNLSRWSHEMVTITLIAVLHLIKKKKKKLIYEIA